MQVLLGQDLGGRHDRRLVARLDRGQHAPARRRSSCPSRRRPAAAGASGCGAAMSPPDLVPDALLRAGERARQRAAAAAHESARRVHRDAPRCPRRARAQDGQAELEQQEILVGEPTMRGLQGGLVRRKVARPGAPRATPRRCAGAGPSRTASRRRRPRTPPRDATSARVERAAGALRSSSRRAPARPRGSARPSPGLDQLPVLHLQGDLVAVARAAAVQDQLLAALQDAREKAAAEERRRAVAAGVAQEEHEGGARRPGAAD